MNLGMPEMIFIFLLALVIFGPRKLPELGKQLGKALTEFKRASNEFKYQLESEIKQIDDGADLVKTARDVQSTFSQPVSATVFNSLMNMAVTDEARKIQPPAAAAAASAEAAQEPLTTNPAAVEAAQAIAAEIQAARMKNWQAEHPESASAEADAALQPTSVPVARDPNV